jgi:hypothetical protein
LLRPVAKATGFFLSIDKTLAFESFQSMVSERMALHKGQLKKIDF